VSRFLETLLHFVITFAVCTVAAGVIWLCTVIVLHQIVALRKHGDLEPAVTELQPRGKWRHWTTIVVVGFVGPGLFGKYLVAQAHVAAILGTDFADSIVGAIPLAVLLLAALGWQFYKDRRLQPDDIRLSKPFNSTFCYKWNTLMLAGVGRAVGTFCWLLAGIAGSIAGAYNSPEFMKLATHAPDADLWSAAGAEMFYMGIFVVVLIVRRVASPHWVMVNAWFSITNELTGGPQPGKSKNDFRVARWRNPYHRKCFLLAKRLERCLPGVQRRLDPSDGLLVTTTYSQLATALRRAGARASKDDTASKRIDDLVAASFGLLVETNLPQAAVRIRHLLRDEPEPTPISHNPLRRYLVSASAAIQQHWPTVKTVGFLLAIAALIASGEIRRTVEAFLK
jgi:hypothetical protein